ncbi:MAG: putative two-component sensor histidine kinase protein [Pedosphaera sp.]|nr:putative two-component sensor histidine kinase protein [Pedosphaera sp.]
MNFPNNLLPLDLQKPITDGAHAPHAHCNDMGESEHFVQFYEDDAFLVESVGAFVGAGLGAGNGAIVIATPAHREALEERLEAQGLDLDAIKKRGQYVPLDAAETLAKFMVNGTPDEDLFNEVVGGLVTEVAKGRRGLRAFGEMVALLWAEGNGSAAIRLEELWNDLGKVHSFSLFCAYPMKGFRGEANGEPFIHICKEHSRVIPSESYAAKGRTDDERLRTIALLQQKATSLEAEVLERKRAEEALRHCNEELTSFFENATLGLHWVRADGTIKWANPAEFQLLGYTKEEYTGHHIAEFHADKAVIEDILARLSRAEKLKNYEARLRCKDGSIKHVLIDSSVLWNEGEFIHTQCFTRDVTEQKKAEAELHAAQIKLQEHAKTLEQGIAERTAQLRETIAELEAFSYSISHDMRSPLRAMQGYATALLMDYGPKLDADAVTSLERIERASNRLDMLVRDVLAYSKIAKGKIELQAVDLWPLMEDIIHQHPEFESVKQCITVEQPMHTVMGHEACLYQCLTNLIGNALKFVAPGTVPDVRVRSELMGNKVRVWVSDNGVGIHPEHHDRIFQIFGRVYSEKRYEGTGIGLAIVKKAVMRMGGEIGFQSELDKGSAFWFILPVASHDH